MGGSPLEPGTSRSIADVYWEALFDVGRQLATHIADDEIASHARSVNSPRRTIPPSSPTAPDPQDAPQTGEVL